MFVLSYDATKFEHADGDGEAGDIQVPKTYYPFDNQLVKIKEHPMGLLGIYRSKTRAMIIGKKWVYDQLDRVEHYTIQHPIPRDDDDEFDTAWGAQPWPGTWRRIGWGYSDSDDSYYVIDQGRSIDYEPVSLGVRIEKRVLDHVEDGEEYHTDEEEDKDEDDDAMDSDGSDYEDEVPEEGRASAGIVGPQASAA